MIFDLNSGGGGPVISAPAPSISLNSGTGIVTATYSLPQGKVTDPVSASSTYGLPTRGATTITPGTSSQTAIPAGYFATGNITVAGDADLVAGNIRNGVNIFGVTGSLKAVDGHGTVYFTGNDTNTIVIDLGLNINTVAAYSIIGFPTTSPAPRSALISVAATIVGGYHHGIYIFYGGDGAFAGTNASEFNSNPQTGNQLTIVLPGGKWSSNVSYTALCTSVK